MVTVFEVTRVIQRSELVMRIVKEIEGYINELGVEGRLVSMQMHELVVNVGNGNSFDHPGLRCSAG